MVKADVIELVKDTPSAHGVHTKPGENKRTVMVNVKSVRQSEYYSAYNAGLTPTMVFELALADEYDDELTCVYHEKTYRIIRTYETESGGIELTVQRSDSQ